LLFVRFCCFPPCCNEFFGCCIQMLHSNVAMEFLGCCNRCFCDVAVLLFDMLQYIIFYVAAHNFRCCSTYFLMLQYMFFQCCTTYFCDVAAHNFLCYST
jgi:hypothetical protein